MRFDVHVFIHNDPSVDRKLEAIMATLQDVLDNEANEATQIGVIKTIIDTLKQQLADILSGATLPPDVQKKVDDLFAASTANKAALDALAAGNPPPAAP